ncbi:lipopolysaccharide transport periplasmic protein LptA [Aidingimonas halophila]|uniref:Lipopolysaccharide export system protein LptA n=1 Tax=Aidingimonas halophila TaxID=574349 RepID=A0A1H2QYG0_9GAMM|nr:lipopolysaccharide transport periplasmic protein LptA [Aidingimonas halophila]GHC20086.1 lipopolysaccharide export system protein LptA [Aidingimonas halophila]SDW12203.1 lipopolysaccharide export system protein LptA [Aidingimonas halophila]
MIRRPASPVTTLIVSAVLMMTPLTPYALEGDAEAPIEVTANQLDLDDNKGTAIYTGDVEMEQGSMKLTGDRVEILRNDAGEVTRVTATGNDGRAYIEQQPAEDEPIVKGWGHTVIYHAAERRVELYDDAELHQARDRFNGAFVEYFLDRRQVQARSEREGSDERERVRMTLNPEQQ